MYEGQATALTLTPVQPNGIGLTVFSRQREKLRGNTVPPGQWVIPWLPPQL